MFYVSQFISRQFLPVWSGVGETAKLQWLVWLRWYVVASLLLLAVPAFFYHFLDVLTLPLYMGVVSLLIVFNLLSQGLWLSKSPSISQWTVLMQILLDLLILSGLLVISGGLNNPFYVLFYINMALGAILLEGLSSLVFLLCGHLYFLVLQLLSWGSLEPFVHVIVPHAVILVSYLISKTLGVTLRRQQNQLIQAQAFSEKMNRLRALGALSAGFTHQFASPLQALRLRLEREARQHRSRDLDEALGALTECEQIIIAMNRSQLDMRELPQQEFELERVVEDIMTSWSEDAQVPVTFHNFVSKRMRVSLPIVSLTQALINLLDNAAEASAQSAIQIHLYERAQRLCVEVRDQGTGFSAEVIKRLGEPFLTEKLNGIGLGLYSTQLFLQSMGGEIKIENNKPRGASVSLLFPLHIVKTQQEGVET